MLQLQSECVMTCKDLIQIIHELFCLKSICKLRSPGDSYVATVASYVLNLRVCSRASVHYKL